MVRKGFNVRALMLKKWEFALGLAEAGLLETITPKKIAKNFAFLYYITGRSNVKFGL